MPVSSDAQAAGTALNNLAGALTNLYTESLTVAGPPTYGDLQDVAIAAQTAAIDAVNTFRSNASTANSVNGVFRGVTQTMVQLASRVQQLLSTTPCLNDTDASDAAAQFIAAVPYYEAMES